MESEKIMRTSMFGGFKKEDVLSYVEQLQKQIEQLKQELESKDEVISKLNADVSQLTKECEELSALKQEVEEKSQKIESLENENNEIKAQVSELTSIAQEYNSAKAAIEENNKDIKAAQARLGAAFLDARKYSENIVAAANEKAHNTSMSISEDISKQAGEISRLSQEVDRISLSFTKSIGELQANISVLSQRMAAAAKNLTIRQDAVFEPDLSLNFEVDKDASSIIETNDGSGLTYIQYPPHTEFNEDLNIKPDSTFSFDTKEG